MDPSSCRVRYCFAGMEGTNGHDVTWFTTSKWKVNAADVFLAVIRSFEGRSVIYPSFFFSFPLARKEDEETMKSTGNLSSCKQTISIKLTFQKKKIYVFIGAVGWIGSTSGRGNEETKIDFKIF
jgi:hypothetical protein